LLGYGAPQLQILVWIVSVGPEELTDFEICRVVISKRDLGVKVAGEPFVQRTSEIAGLDLFEGFHKFVVVAGWREFKFDQLSAPLAQPLLKSLPSFANISFRCLDFEARSIPRLE
jgi:hypothetical protein